MKGLGRKSEALLRDVGIHTPGDLERIGPVAAFIKLRDEGRTEPSLNFLYAMVGALENRRWTDIAREERTALLLELDGWAELERTMPADEG